MSIEINRVPFDRPWVWLAAGWRDLWAAPQISLVYGIGFVAVSLLLTFGLIEMGAQSLLPVLGGGFLLLGPMLAGGLYETSRRLAAGEPVSLGQALAAGLNSPSQLASMGVVLLVIYFAWVIIALLLFMLFLGQSGLPPPEDFVHTLLFTRPGLGLLCTGTLVGGLLAAAVYMVTAISVPMVMNRSIDVVTAGETSVRACLKNPRPMMLWGGLIAVFMMSGIVTLFLGLAIAFPLVGHATWHAYQDLVGGHTP